MSITPINSIFPATSPGAPAGQHLHSFSGLEAPFQNKSEILFLNFATRNVETEGRATTLYGLHASEQALAFADLLGTKAFLMSDGCCVLSHQQRERIEQYARYAAKHGLSSPAAIENVLFVEDTAEVLSVFAALRERNKLRASEQGMRLYLETARAHELALSQGIALKGCGAQVANDVIDRFSNKSEFRDLIYQQMHEQLRQYPRAVIQGNLEYSEKSIQKLIQQIETAVSYYSPGIPGGSQPILFLQASEAAGGNGNIPVQLMADGALEFVDFHGRYQTFKAGHQQIRQLVTTLLGQQLDLEVAPYLRLTDSFSYSVFLADHEGLPRDCAILHRQLLNPETKSYRGGVLDIHEPGSLGPQADLERAVVAQVSQSLRAFGFRGPFSIDFFRYIDSQGAEQVAVAEVNLRRTSPSFVLGVVVRDEQRRQLLSSGKLSLLLDDKFEIGEELSQYLRKGARVESESLLKGAELLAEVFAANQIPMLNDAEGQKFGVLLLTPPLPKDSQDFLSLAIVAETDREKYEIYEKIKKLVG